MEYNLINWFLSTLPIILFITLIVGFNWKSSKTAALSWLATMIISIVFFGANAKIIGYAYVKAFLQAIDVLMIIWAALFLFELTEYAGALKITGEWLSSLSHNRAMKGIILGWIFPSFLQGLGGFGVPVAIAAPLLVGAGFAPVQSIVMASIGHAWGITFGSMASSFQTMMSITSIPGEILTPSTTILLGILAIVCGFLVTFMADGFNGFIRNIPVTLPLGLLLAAGQNFFSESGLFLLAVTIPSLAALFVCFFLLSKQSASVQISKELLRRIWISVSPYLILVLLTVGITLINPITTWSNKYSVSIIFPELITSYGYIIPVETGRNIQFFNHPGFIIFLTGLISYLIFMKAKLIKFVDFGEIIKTTVWKSVDTTITVFCMVGIAVIMTHTQMTDILARGMSQTFERNLFPFISPLIGVIGGFISGSNTNSNILFAAIQMQTAELLDLHIPFILAAQTAGGAIGSVMSPAKLVIGCATVGLIGNEGKVIGKILIFGLSLTILIGLLTFLFSSNNILNVGEYIK